MNPTLIETEDGDVLGIYVDGFVNKQIFIGYFNHKVSIKYQWCKLKKDEKGEEYLTFCDKEEIGSFGITAIYW